MNRLRIIHVVHSLGTGGTEAGIRKLLAGLVPDAFDQIVCTIAPAPPVEPQSGARVISLDAEPGFLIGKLRKVFVRERPHIVHSRNWGAIEAVPAARLASVEAVIHSEHGLEAGSIQQQPARRRMFRRLCFSWADRVFAVSEGLRTYYAQQLRMSANRMFVVPNGVDTERFRRDPLVRKSIRRSWNLTPETLVIGTVGRLDPVKDHSTLLKGVELALSRGLTIALVIVGDGAARGSLEKQVQTRSLLAGRTRFVGETYDVAPLLNGFDVFVLPSLAEGMSNALLEAMSVGVAPIATRVGGNPELIEEGVSGLLFDVGDAGMLATYIHGLESDRSRCGELGLNARKRVEECFSLRRMLANYASLYREAAGGHIRSSFQIAPTARNQTRREVFGRNEAR